MVQIESYLLSKSVDLLMDLYTSGIGNSYINHVNLINSRESRDFARSTYFHWRHLEFRMRRLPDQGPIYLGVKLNEIQNQEMKDLMGT